jgi:hypothetical protein
MAHLLLHHILDRNDFVVVVLLVLHIHQMFASLVEIVEHTH